MIQITQKEREMQYKLYGKWTRDKRYHQFKNLVPKKHFLCLIEKVYFRDADELRRYCGQACFSLMICQLLLLALLLF